MMSPHFLPQLKIGVVDDLISWVNMLLDFIVGAPWWQDGEITESLKVQHPHISGLIWLVMCYCCQGRCCYWRWPAAWVLRCVHHTCMQQLLTIICPHGVCFCTSQLRSSAIKRRYLDHIPSDLQQPIRQMYNHLLSLRPDDDGVDYQLLDTLLLQVNIAQCAVEETSR